MRFVPAPVDRYEVLDFLAEGGMGSIYLGKKRGAGGFEKEVVLKQLRPEYTEQPEFIELFLREARLSAVLDHANIVHTLDLVHAGAEYFMVMEYVRGGDLRVLLRRARKRKRRLAPAAALFIAREVLAALVYAHNRRAQDGKPLGLIHRDVSPSNILVSGAGEVKLTDFGIAKATTHQSTFYRVRGKVGYMSPEQARSQPLEPRSDVYSVAVILWEMLTAERLHVAASLTTSADEMYGQPVPPASAKVAGLPREVDQVLARGLAVDPEARYQTASDLMEDLLRVAARHDLMYSALALSRHLVDLCGPVEAWGTAEVHDAASTASEEAEPVGTERLPVPGAAPPRAGAARAAAAPGDVDADGDLLWVDKLDEAPGDAVLHALPRARGHGPGEGAARLPADLAPVADFLLGRVESVAPSVVRPRRRVPALLVGTLVALGLVALALVIGTGGLERPPEVTPRAAPAPPPPRPRPTPPARPPVKLAIDSEPPRARVLVAGQVRCATPCTLDAPAPPAATLVLLAREGYLPWSALIVPTGDGLKARLRREPPRGTTGQLIFRNAPAANVLVGGKPIGYATGPLPAGGAEGEPEPLVLPVGEQVIELVAPAGDPAYRRELRIVVRAGQATEVDLARP